MNHYEQTLIINAKSGPYFFDLDKIIDVDVFGSSYTTTIIYDCDGEEVSIGVYTDAPNWDLISYIFNRLLIFRGKLPERLQASYNAYKRYQQSKFERT